MKMQCHPIIDMDVTMRMEDMTKSCFPQTNELLNVTSIQKSLKLVATKKDMGFYHCMTDFIFCELFTDFKDPCFSFYKGDGPNLKTFLTKQMGLKDTKKLLFIFDITLVFCLQLCEKVIKKEQQMSWEKLENSAQKFLMRGGEKLNNQEQG